MSLIETPHRSQPRRMRGAVVAGVLAATPLALLAAPAEAATSHVAAVVSQDVQYRSSGDTSNHVVVNRLGTVFYIDDRVAIQAGNGCHYPNPSDRTAVWCDAPKAARIYIYVGPGNDTVVADQTMPTSIFGGSGNDTLTGSTRGDRIYGDSGADTLYGGKGDDTVRGGADNDTIYGWRGDDVLYGDEGDDTIWGQQSKDELHGDNGNDRLDGGDGDNQLYGGSGKDACANGPFFKSC